MIIVEYEAKAYLRSLIDRIEIDDSEVRIWATGRGRYSLFNELATSHVQTSEARGDHYGDSSAQGFADWTRAAYL